MKASDSKTPGTKNPRPGGKATTLIGAGQGLFLGLYAAELAAALNVVA